MGQEQFNAILPVISADLSIKISEMRGVAEDKAIELLYTSRLYAALEQEETKVWQYCTDMLYSLLEREWETGEIAFPDV